MVLNLNKLFTKELPADTDTNNVPRQVYNACFSYVSPKIPSNPSIIHVVHQMAEEIGLNKNDIEDEDFVAFFSGAKIYPNTQPFALCYAGHQFGNWAGQLGDGRAINLMEINHKEKNFTLQLKGAGPTPYSRTADGLAVLRSSIREYLCAEAMHHLGVPTTSSPV
ncbi:hypothetical protein BXU11_17340 [Flavobacterium sp. LM5]|nr:hypothetical protein BXU11_17340 [Flavobacterium sp. LM5]